MVPRKRMNRSIPFVLLVVIGLTITACAQPETVEKVVKETVEVEKVVTETVIETVVVEGTPQTVEVEVTKIVEVEAARWAGRGFGGVLKVPVGDLIPSLDPHSNVATVVQQTVNVCWEGLVTLSEDFKVIPMLAEKWEISPDGLTYTFYLRRGVKFHNGAEMTSADVIATVNRYLEVTPRQAQFEKLESYEAVDDYTVTFRLSSPSASFLTALALPQAQLGIFPKEVIEGKAADGLEIPGDLIGTGPYKVAEYKPDQLLRLVRHEEYEPLPGQRDGLGGAKIPYFDEILFLIVPEAASLSAGLETGEYDIIGLSGEEYDLYKDSNEIDVQITQPIEKAAIVFNHRADLTSQLKFRQAVNAAVNIQEVMLASAEGREDFVAFNHSLWPPHSYWYYDDPVGRELYNEYDPDKARQLLEEMGYAGEEVVIITMAPDTWAGPPLLVVADQLRQVGINVREDVYDWPTMFEKWGTSDEWHISWNAWSTAYNVNPQVYRNQFDSRMPDGGERYGYENPEIDALFDQAEEALTLQERKEAYNQIQELVWKDLNRILAGDFRWVVGYRADIKGFQAWYRDRYFGVWREE